jgi:hypothetical protein
MQKYLGKMLPQWLEKCTETQRLHCLLNNLETIHSFTGAYSPTWTFGLPFRCYLITHIQTHGRTPLDE